MKECIERVAQKLTQNLHRSWLLSWGASFPLYSNAYYGFLFFFFFILFKRQRERKRDRLRDRFFILCFALQMSNTIRVRSGWSWEPIPNLCLHVGTMDSSTWAITCGLQDTHEQEAGVEAGLGLELSTPIWFVDVPKSVLTSVPKASCLGVIHPME